MGQEYDKSIADYTEAIRLDPKFAGAYYYRGLALATEHEHDKAIDDFNEAIRLDPKHARAFHNRGDVWSDKQEYDKAIDDYSEAIRLDPKLAGTYVTRGMAWSVAKQQYDKAIADFTEAIRLDPPNRRTPPPTDAAPFAWQKKQEYGKAIADFRRGRSESTRKIRPRPPPPSRGLAWHDQQEYDKAIADFTEAIRLDPRNTAPPITTAATPWHSTQSLRQGDCRFQRGDPNRPERRPLLQQPRLDLGDMRRCENPRWQAGRRLGDHGVRIDVMGRPGRPGHTRRRLRRGPGDFDAAARWRSKATRTPRRR